MANIQPVYSHYSLLEVEESEALKKEKELQRQRQEAVRKEEEAKKEMMRQQFEKAKQRKLKPPFVK